MMFTERVQSLLEEERTPPPEYINSLGRLLHLNGRLTWRDTVQAMRLLIESTPQEGDRLAFLREFRPETADGEMLAAAAAVLRAVAPRVPCEESPLFDTCGTGGDRLGLFNVSTLAALVVSAAGVPVVKHGNRAITSDCGSADLVEALGIAVELDPDQAARSLEEMKFAFLFAPYYHQATRNVQPLRKRLSAEGIPTVFNLLGPLTNPGHPSHQLVGVYHPRFLRPMAEALVLLGCERAWVVSGVAGENEWMDEISLSGTTRVVEVDELGGLTEREIHPSDVGLDEADLEELKGGDIKHNLEMAEKILKGNHSAVFDMVCFNAGAGLYVAGAVPGVPAGVEEARKLLVQGTVWEKVEELSGSRAEIGVA